MGSFELEILAVNLYSHYYVVFGKPPAESEPQLSFSCKLERMFWGDSFVNKYFQCIYVSSDV